MPVPPSPLLASCVGRIKNDPRGLIGMTPKAHGLVGGSMALGLGFEVSKAHTQALAQTQAQSLSFPVCVSRCGSQLRCPVHAMLPAVMTVIMD